VVAGGSAATVAAATEVLSEGGNAFDAAVAGGLAAGVAEPALTSLAGGGFMTARKSDGEQFVADFFVSVPGIDAEGAHDPNELVAVPVHFGGAVQDFHVGAASVAVPGCLPGYLAVHERHGRMELARVVAPAVRLARSGVEIDRWQAHVLTLLEPILARNPEGRELFFDDTGTLLGAGSRMVNPALAQFLDDIGAGARHGFRAGELGGQVTGADLESWSVEWREPLQVPHGGGLLAINPAPSFGGRLVAHALEQLADAPRLTGVDGPDAALALAGALESLHGYRSTLGEGTSRGTTHMGVIDHDGNTVALTTSNGSCSGEFASGLGVQLNNMMGESDLHPGGFGSATPGQRIGSMMAPGILTLPEGHVALGSGGSERIRSTITQLVERLSAGATADEAVRAPRIHWAGSTMQVEPGWSGGVLDALSSRWPVNVWQGRDLYFGGAHLVADDGRVGPDPRRGGVGATVTAAT